MYPQKPLKAAHTQRNLLSDFPAAGLELVAVFVLQSGIAGEIGQTGRKRLSFLVLLAMISAQNIECTHLRVIDDDCRCRASIPTGACVVTDIEIRAVLSDFISPNVS